MAYKIALTGGIGTGKTYLSKHFVEMGVPVFYADDEAKKLYRETKFLQELANCFGPEILDNAGQLNFKKFSGIIFSNEDNLRKINELVHPKVMELFENWMNAQSAQAVMMESAVIFEGGLESFFDKIIVADAPVELRIKRILARNPELSREEILQRMARQLPQEEKCRRADLVVCTGETYRESR